MSCTAGAKGCEMHSPQHHQTRLCTMSHLRCTSRIKGLNLRRAATWKFQDTRSKKRNQNTHNWETMKQWNHKSNFNHAGESLLKCAKAQPRSSLERSDLSARSVQLQGLPGNRMQLHDAPLIFVWGMIISSHCQITWKCCKLLTVSDTHSSYQPQRCMTRSC